MQGNNYQLDKEPLLQIPIFNVKDESQFTKIVDQILKKKKKTPKPIPQYWSKG